MSEEFIIQYIPQRVRQLGFSEYHLNYRDLLVEKCTSMNIPAYNELYFIIDDPDEMIVESDYGVYDSTDCPVDDNIHQHRGEIVIQNKSNKDRRIKFIQVLMVN